MSFRNEYSTIPNSKRPKLYKEMEANPYGLPQLDLSKLFIYLDEKNEIINNIIRNKYHKVMKFKYYAEFLNVLNFAFLFYKLNFNMVLEDEINYSKTLFIILELSILFFSISVFLIYNKNKKLISEIKQLMFFGIISIIFSKIISFITGVEKSIHKFGNYRHLIDKEKNILKEKNLISNLYNNLELTLDYIRINYFFFLFFFLLLNDYLVNNENTNIFLSLLISILILIMSIIHEQFFMKIRCMLIGINIFELMPKIRKFANSISDKVVTITYCINSITCGISLFYIDEINSLIGVILLNISFIIFYPILFNCCYHKQKLFMKGMWDVPELTKFQ